MGRPELAFDDDAEEVPVDRGEAGAAEAVWDGADGAAGVVLATGVLRLQATVSISKDTARNEDFLMFLVNNEVERNSTPWLQFGLVGQPEVHRNRGDHFGRLPVQ